MRKLNPMIGMWNMYIFFNKDNNKLTKAGKIGLGILSLVVIAAITALIILV